MVVDLIHDRQGKDHTQGKIKTGNKRQPLPGQTDRCGIRCPKKRRKRARKKQHGNDADQGKPAGYDKPSFQELPEAVIIPVCHKESAYSKESALYAS